jgi:hypothetical protein
MLRQRKLTSTKEPVTGCGKCFIVVTCWHSKAAVRRGSIRYGMLSCDAEAGPRFLAAETITGTPEAADWRLSVARDEGGISRVTSSPVWKKTEGTVLPCVNTRWRTP